MRGSLLVISFFSLWQMIVSISNLPSYILPSPRETLISLWEFKNVIAYHSYITLLEMLVGLVISFVLAVVSGITMDRLPKVQKLVYPLCLTLQSIPTFILMPLLLIWIGFGFSSKVIVIVLASYFSLTLSVMNGLRQTPKNYSELTQLLRADYLRELIYIRLPFALPSFMAGLSIVIIHAPVTAIAADWVGASEGLGYLILTSHAQLEIDLVFASILILIVSVFLLNKGVEILNSFVSKKMQLELRDPTAS